MIEMVLVGACDYCDVIDVMRPLSLYNLTTPSKKRRGSLL
jgi:hypothetical protein